jgi:nitrite reductase/ring-hydroxylating ferredoxin subunit
MNMKKKVVIAALALLVVGGVAVLGYVAYGKSACVGSAGGRSCCRASGGNVGTGDTIAPTWIDPLVEGDLVSIPLSELGSDKIVHFAVTAEGARMTFMAYELGEQVYVRAAICPPCRSQSFSLEGDTLVCDTCGTKFRASDGQGISGACKSYPKAEVAYAVAGDRLTVTMDDLVAAYENTNIPGLP